MPTNIIDPVPPRDGKRKRNRQEHEAAERALLGFQIIVIVGLLLMVFVTMLSNGLFDPPAVAPSVNVNAPAYSR
jgi:hypothetical protein